MRERAVIEHRQVESRAIPGHERRRVAIEPVEKALHELALACLLFAEAEHAHAFGASHHARDRNHTLLMRRQHVTVSHLPLLERHHVGDRRVVETVEVVESAAELDVGYGLDVERERVHWPPRAAALAAVPFSARMSTATAITSPASSLSVRCPSPTPSWSQS